MRVLSCSELSPLALAGMGMIACSSSSAPTNTMDASPADATHEVVDVARGDASPDGSDARSDARSDAGADAGSCTSDIPQLCGMHCDGGCCVDDSCITTPSFKTDVVPVLHDRCIPCHFDGGTEDFMFDFSTYAGVDNADIAIQGAVDDCTMPPTKGIPKLGVKPGWPPLTPEQRKTLLDWLICGAPNN